MTKRSTFVGLDVHKEFIGVAIADSGRFGEVPTYGTVGATSMCSKTPPSSSLIPKRAGGRVKTDRRDAVTLARWHRAGELRPIYVPNESDEALRDLVRAREDAVEVAREAKQRLKAVNLRHGLRYRGRAGWTIPYRRWPADLTMSVPAPQFALQEYLAPVEEAEACVARLAEQLRQLVPLWRWAPVVEALRLTKHSHINVRIQRRRPEYGDAGVRWNPWLLRPISTGRLAQFVIRLHYRCSRHPAARLAVRGIRVLPSVYGVYPGFPTLFWGLSVFFVGDLMGKALWKLVENAARFPRRGGRVLCVHGAVSFHRARPCGPRWLPGRGAMRHVELDRRVLGLQSTGE